MRIIFFGTSNFAAVSLERLIASRHKVIACVTQPDRKKGRELKLEQPLVKKISLEHDIVVFQPNDLSGDFVSDIQLSHPDLFVVIEYGRILKKELLDIPKYYAVNVHASLLPKYRGAAPINWAIANGDTVTGVTVIKLNELMDGGDIIMQRSLEIAPEDSAVELGRKLADLGAELLLESIDLIEQKNDKLIKQDGKAATSARKLRKEDGLIDWKLPARVIHDRVRGLAPWPGTYTMKDGKKINIIKTAVSAGHGAPGVIVEAKERLLIGTGDGLLEVREIQLEGKKHLAAAEFLRGYRQLKQGDKFTA